MVVFDAYLSKLKLSVYLNVFNAPYVLKICKCVKNYFHIFYVADFLNMQLYWLKRLSTVVC